ncbi:sugar phosphate nucleotidyltransferase, partial [Escherichia coli]|uniref:sugar phosphate nucleotidyltransferase n=1 Tax=Escherichia coli TaxID=562 RepID=UPI0035D3FF3B
PKLRHVAARTEGATVFGYQVMEPERCGAVECDDKFRATLPEEKPTQRKTKRTGTGVSFMRSKVAAYAERWERLGLSVREVCYNQQRSRLRVVPRSGSKRGGGGGGGGG